MKPFLSLVALLALLCFWSLPCLAAAEAGAPVTLQLKWRHQFQFAGYYAALEKGYYRAAGLDVRIKEAKPGLDVVDTVVRGEADFGVGNSDLLLARHNGKPVVALAVIFQHSPACILAARGRGIETIADLAGRTVRYEAASTELIAFLKRSGVDTARLKLLPYNPDLSDLVEGRVDAIPAYITSETYDLTRRGFPYLEFRPLLAGIDFYGDTLFTRERLARDQPELAAAFRAASLKGWQYAMAHPEEIIDLILAKYPSGNDRGRLQWEARRIHDLMMPELVEVGYMSPQRWRGIADTYAELGFLPAGFDFSLLLFEPGDNTDHRVLYGYLASLAAALMVMAGVLFIILRGRRRLAQSQARHELTAATVPGVLFDYIRHADGREEIVYVSPRCREILELDEATLLSDPGRLVGMMHPEDVEGFLEARRLARENRATFLAEARLCLPSGRVRWIQFSARASPVSSMAGVYWSGILLDVTERHEAEAAMRESEDRFRSLVSAMGEGVIRVDAAGVIEDCNPAAERMLGLARHQLIGKSTQSNDWVTRHLDGSPFPPEDYPVSVTLRKGESQRDVAMELTTLQGEHRWLSISTDPIRIGNSRTITGAVVTFSDISERKRMEDALRESENRFRAMADAAPVLMWLAGIDKGCTWFNQTWLAFTGRSMDQEVGEGWAGNIHPEDALRTLETYGKAFEAREPFRCEYRLRRCDGAYRWLLDVGVPRFDEGGRFTGYIGSCADITDNKASEALLRGVLDATDEGVLVVGLEGRVLAYNQRFMKLWGVPENLPAQGKEALLGHVSARTEDPRAYLSLVQSLYLSNEEREDELRLKDGRTFLRFTRLVFVGGMAARVWTFRDMTQLLGSQKAIRDERARLRTLLETIPEPIWLKDPEGVYLACNPAFERIYNLREADLVGHTDYDLTDRESADFLRGKDREAMEAGRTILSEEWISYPATGEKVLMAKYKTPMRDGDGRLVGVLGIGRDITDERRASTDLAEAKELAEAANRAKSQFLSRMSHELRTPLNAIIGFSELLKYDTEAPLNPQPLEFIGHILDGGTHLLSLVNEVLDLSRIESGRLELDIAPVSLPNLMSECLDMVKRQAEARGIHLEGASQVGKTVLADPVRLKQILLNLLSNAVKYNRPQGTVSVSCSANPGGLVHVAVSDTGPGIPLERQTEVFQPFQRLGAENTAVEGTGIGLTISKRLIEAMGGRIGFDSKPGLGTTFWVELPSVSPT